jgi:hypothetical protein
MHRQMRHSLEDFLRVDDDLKGSDLSTEFQAHLGECGECAKELRALQAQAQLLRSLKDVGNVEPRAGFYARVMERIEARPASMWSVFLDRKFGLRLAIGSAALAALLGTYLVTSEPSGPEAASAPLVVSTDIPRQQQQRDAVLVDLASYHQ